MAGNDDLIARLRDADAWAGLLNGGSTVLEEAATALTDRDAQIERLKKEAACLETNCRDFNEAGLAALDQRDKAKADGKFWENFCKVLQDDCDKFVAQRDAAEARATAAERDLAEARAEVERLKKAVSVVTDATAAYLPPDGISAVECISRVLAATDNPEINAIMLEKNDGRPQN